MKTLRFTVALSILALCTMAATAGELLKPPAIWKDYDPNKGDFKEEIINEETKDGIYTREFYISAYVLNEEIRVYCKYSVKEGVMNAPGLLNVRGWMRCSPCAGQIWGRVKLVFSVSSACPR